jgi:hypothetical protein
MERRCIIIFEERGQQNKRSLPLLLYNQYVINENQQKCEALGKEMVSFFFPFFFSSFCHAL